MASLLARVSLLWAARGESRHATGLGRRPIVSRTEHTGPSGPRRQDRSGIVWLPRPSKEAKRETAARPPDPPPPPRPPPRKARHAKTWLSKDKRAWIGFLFFCLFRRQQRAAGDLRSVSSFSIRFMFLSVVSIFCHPFFSCLRLPLPVVRRTTYDGFLFRTSYTSYGTIPCVV